MTLRFPLDTSALDALVAAALREDVGSGDVTTDALVPAGTTGSAAVIARDRCVVAGLPVAGAVFAATEPDLTWEACVNDGETVLPGTVVCRVSGPVRGILTGERTALNFLQRLCGIATLTARYVEIASRFGAAILDTRKTAPTLRALEKYAVLCGGGVNHRMGLYDRAMIKDNHRRIWQEGGRGGLAAAVNAIRSGSPGIPVEVEVETLEELEAALQAGPEWILLDNMAPALMRACVERIGGRCRVEASGGISLDTLEAVARTGVDAVSIGALTHSAPAADLSLEIT